MNREDLKDLNRWISLGMTTAVIVFLDKDGYIAALENYLSDLEKRYKELQDALEVAG